MSGTCNSPKSVGVLDVNANPEPRPIAATPIERPILGNHPGMSEETSEMPSSRPDPFELREPRSRNVAHLMAALQDNRRLMNEMSATVEAGLAAPNNGTPTASASPTSVLDYQFETDDEENSGVPPLGNPSPIETRPAVSTAPSMDQSVPIDIPQSSEASHRSTSPPRGREPYRAGSEAIARWANNNNNGAAMSDNQYDDERIVDIDQLEPLEGLYPLEGNPLVDASSYPNVIYLRNLNLVLA